MLGRGTCFWIYASKEDAAFSGVMRELMYAATRPEEVCVFIHHSDMVSKVLLG